jgi:hypothetical protein
MAVSDIVSPHIRVNQDPQTLHDQPPTFGILAEESMAFPGSLRILWDSMTVADLVVAALADANLDKITSATAAVIDNLIGRYVVRVTGTTNLDLDPSGGTSREYAGKVVAIYQRTRLGSMDTPVDFVLVQTDDGTFYEDVASRWVPVENR